MIQGYIGNCTMITYIQALSQNPDLIKKLFKFYNKRIGYYALNLYDK